jgi:hypothetical protein
MAAPGSDVALRPVLRPSSRGYERARWAGLGTPSQARLFVNPSAHEARGECFDREEAL